MVSLWAGHYVGGLNLLGEALTLVFSMGGLAVGVPNLFGEVLIGGLNFNLWGESCCRWPQFFLGGLDLHGLNLWAGLYVGGLNLFGASLTSVFSM